MSRIVLSHIDKFYGDNHVLRDINLTIEDGDFMTLLGPSGCGKTTTLRVIAGLERPQNGVMTIDGAEMLRGFGFACGVSREELKARVDSGWAAYGAYRDATDVELKPISIWRDYVLKSFDFPTEALAPHCEELAHMWELTHYRRSLRPRAKEMLEGLQSMGLKLGIISNTAALYQVFDSLEAYGIRDFFQDVTLSSVTGMRKPAPHIFRVALRQLRSEPRECVYVGDTVSRDVIGAKRAGFAAAIQIRSHLTPEKDRGVSREYEPDYVIEDIYQVDPLLRGMMDNALFGNAG